jgi:hypothetical protein
MTWDEYQDLTLKIAREVGATFNLTVEIAEPEDPSNSAIEFKPVAIRRRGFFFRRAKLRGFMFAFYRSDNLTQPYFKQGGGVDLNALDEFDFEIYRRHLEVLLREILELIKQRGNQTGRT